MCYSSQAGSRPASGSLSSGRSLDITLKRPPAAVPLTDQYARACEVGDAWLTHTALVCDGVCLCVFEAEAERGVYCYDWHAEHMLVSWMTAPAWRLFHDCVWVFWVTANLCVLRGLWLMINYWALKAVTGTSLGVHGHLTDMCYELFIRGMSLLKNMLMCVVAY